MGRTFSISEVRKIMDKPNNIRNMSVIAHVDHGKSTLTDSLISLAGLISKAKSGEQRFMDTRADEQERAITIKSTSVSLLYDLGPKSAPEATESFLVNLIDSPGHVDFSSEVTTALRTTDGALVVVDCVEGVCTQTETVLRMAILERVRPILFLNKLDRVLSELRYSPEQCYNAFRKVIEKVNAIISTFCGKDTLDVMGSLEVSPEKGTVGFGSGLHAWAFTLESFYRRVYNQDPKKVAAATKYLWGEYYWNETKKCFSKNKNDGPRTFNHFIMGPIIDFFQKWEVEKPTKEQSKEREDLLKKYDIAKERGFDEIKKNKDKIKQLFRNWLPAGVSLVQMIVWNLPSPIEAQKYRISRVYGNQIPIKELEDEDKKKQEDLIKTEEYKGISICDPQGPLMVYISKMIPSNEPGRFYAFGRVFSGTITTGDEVYVLADGVDKPIKTKLQKVCLMMGGKTETLLSVPAGNMVGLTGVDKYILKSATICSNPETIPMTAMKFTVSAVVNTAVTVKEGNHLPKLLEGLQKLSKSDPLLKITSDHKSGEHILGCAGELHLEICLKDLREEYCKGINIITSDPIVTYCEGISEESSSPDKICSKSSNKHNRLYMRAYPLSEELTSEIASGEFNMSMDPKERARYLTEKHNFPKGLGRKVWSLGHPEFANCNMLIDNTKAIQNLNEVKDSIITAFTEFTSGGPLAGETVKGVCVELVDANLHVDSTHRGSNQMVPCAKRAMFGAFLAAQPILIEPVYSVEIQVPDEHQNNALRLLNKEKAIHTGTIMQENSPIVKILAELPVARSFGFTRKLRSETAGKAFPTLVPDCWQKVDGKIITDNETPAKSVVLSIRERKGMKKEIPNVSEFHEREIK